MQQMEALLETMSMSCSLQLWVRKVVMVIVMETATWRVRGTRRGKRLGKAWSSDLKVAQYREDTLKCSETMISLPIVEDGVPDGVPD